MSDITPKDCFDELEPMLKDVQRMMLSAPLAPHPKAGLAVLVAVYFYTAAASALAEADGAPKGTVDHKFFRAVNEMIAGHIERGGPLHS